MLLKLAQGCIELFVELLFADLDAVLTEHHTNQVARHPEGVVGPSELQHRRLGGRMTLEQLGKPRLADRQDSAEALLFAANRFVDQLSRRDQFGKGSPIRSTTKFVTLMKERRLESQAFRHRDRSPGA